MKKITKFKSDDGEEFDSKKECEAHEALISEADHIFRDWPVPVDKGCGFSNGDGYISLDKNMYERTRNEFLDLVLKAFPKWGDMKKVVEITRKMDSNWGIIGRYLGDSDTPLYHYWCQFMDVDTKALRLWGQGYYAHNPDKGEQVEWKKVKKWSEK